MIVHLTKKRLKLLQGSPPCYRHDGLYQAAPAVRVALAKVTPLVRHADIPVAVHLSPEPHLTFAPGFTLHHVTHRLPMADLRAHNF